MFRKVHSLIEIGEACTGLDPGLAEISRRVAPISGWAVETRYPGEWSLPTDIEVAEALETVRDLFDAILSRLPGDIEPKRLASRRANLQAQRRDYADMVRRPKPRAVASAMRPVGEQRDFPYFGRVAACRPHHQVVDALIVRCVLGI